MTLGRKVFADGDLFFYNYPLLHTIAAQWKAGHVPIWNDYLFGGTPLLAPMQGGVFYAPNALFLVLPAWLAYGQSIVLHYSLIGVFTFLYLRALRLRPEAGLIGGLVFMLGGFTLANLGHVSTLRTLPWLPLMLYGFERWRQQGDRTALALGGIAAPSCLRPVRCRLARAARGDRRDARPTRASDRLAATAAVDRGRPLRASRTDRLHRVSCFSSGAAAGRRSVPDRHAGDGRRDSREQGAAGAELQRRSRSPERERLRFPDAAPARGSLGRPADVRCRRGGAGLGPAAVPEGAGSPEHALRPGPGSFAPDARPRTLPARVPQLECRDLREPRGHAALTLLVRSLARDARAGDRSSGNGPDRAAGIPAPHGARGDADRGDRAARFRGAARVRRRVPWRARGSSRRPWRPATCGLGAQSPADGVLVHATKYAQDWRAYVDGAPAPLYRVDGLLQGVALPAGRHEVRFVYRPGGFVAGAAISGMTMLLVAAAAWREQTLRSAKEAA